MVILRSAEACPVIELGALWKFSKDFDIVIGIAMVAFGFYLMAFGNYY